MQRVSLAGAPRDLGLEQGQRLRDAIRADARALGWEAEEGWRRWLQRQQATGPDPDLGRDLARHFPHLDERTSGLAAGSGLPREALLVLLEEELSGDLVIQSAGISRGPDGAPRVALRLRTPLPPTGLFARTCQPDGGYLHLALTRPALVAALAGVNEHGLAAAAELLDPATAPPRAGDRCRSPSLLLLDQCIERLDTVEKALEWCERRPGGGHARLVFADATGAVAAMDLDGQRRRQIQAPALEPTPAAGSAWALLDPAARTIEIRLPDAAPELLSLDASS